ncbi:MAG: HAD family phosphatase [Pirellulales bacterium]|nr:HAD family phosphatase [Pirellulales bacterium]
MIRDVVGAAMPPKFIYFDLGNVLLNFSHPRMCRQMAEVTGLSEEAVWQALFGTGLELDYERGRVDTREFYEQFCAATGTRADFDRLALAACDIFSVHVGTKRVLAQLLTAGYRLGLLSNTNEMHWNYFARGRFAMIPTAFEQVVLSFEVGSIKPEAGIFEAAIEQAGVLPGEIFFTDDIAGHVDAARELGIDAVPFTTPAALLEALLARGVRVSA